jgi:hypothetical protein
VKVVITGIRGPMSAAVYLRHCRTELLAQLHGRLDRRCTVALRKNVLHIGVRAQLSAEQCREMACGVLRVIEGEAC